MIKYLNLEGQLVLTFPSYGTFDSLWQRVDHAMIEQGLANERARFRDYLHERPTAQDGRDWLEALDLGRVEAISIRWKSQPVPGQSFSTTRYCVAAFLMTCMNVLRTSLSPTGS